MNEQRRNLLVGGAALTAAALLPTALAGSPAADLSVPALPKDPTPGKPGDFDFLRGEWRIQHWRKPPGAKEWDEFEGEATCWSILGGIGSVEELRIPARQFSGMGLRMLDVERKRWSDHWVNAKSGVVTTPGLEGSFEDGAGLFVSRDTVEDKTVLSAGIWDRITANSCRWRQAQSHDDGKTWEHNWIMHWTRI